MLPSIEIQISYETMLIIGTCLQLEIVEFALQLS